MTPTNFSNVVLRCLVRLTHQSFITCGGGVNPICAGPTTEWPTVVLRLLTMDELTFGKRNITDNTNMTDA